MTQYISASDTKCHELDVATCKLTDLTLKPEGGTAACDFAGYMPDEKSVLMISDYREGRPRLYVRNLKSGKVTEPLPALRAYDLDGAFPNETREMLAVLANQDGYSVPSLYALPGFKPLPLPEMEKGVIGASSFRGRTLVWSLSNARTPGLAHVSVFPPGGGAPQSRQITWADDQGIDLGAFQLPELIRYKSSVDGRDHPVRAFGREPGLSRFVEALGAVPPNDRVAGVVAGGRSNRQTRRRLWRAHFPQSA